MVIILDSSDGGGTHWVACYVSKNQIEYVDRFGLEPPGEVAVYFAR